MDLRKLLTKERNAVDCDFGQTILNMMRDYSEKKANDPTVEPNIIKGMQMLIYHVKNAPLRYDKEKAKES